MRAAAVVVVVVSLTAMVAAGPSMKLYDYEKSSDTTYKRVLVPVSSTVIPLEDLPVFKVGVGVGVRSSITIDEKLRPEGPVKLLTIHNIRKNKKKKADTEKDATAALIEELTEEEYRVFIQQQQQHE